MNLPSNEPKNGDFVAYLAEIERRQMAHLPAELSAPPPLHPESHAPAAGSVQNTGDATHGGASNAAPSAALPKKAAVPRKHGTLANGLFLGAIGFVFLLVGLAMDGGWIAVAIGVFLIWRGVRTLVRARRAGRYEAHTRLAQALEDVRRNAR